MKIFIFLMMLSFNAHAFNIGSETTGSWYDSANSGQGINVEILSGNRILVFWYTYENESPLWLIGQATYSGDTATMDMRVLQGGGFGVHHDAETVQGAVVGAMTLTFGSCNAATMEYNFASTYGYGYINLDRLTNIKGASCSDDGTTGNIYPRCTAENLTQSNVEQLQQGMTVKQVNAVMGCSAIFLTSSIVNEVDVHYYTWIDLGARSGFAIVAGGTTDGTMLVYERLSY